MLKYFIRIILRGVVVVSLFGGFFSTPSLAIAAPVDEVIHDYQVGITLNKDSTIRVEETIEYDFGATPHHGIIRNIPYKYKARGGTFKLRVSDVVVTDDAAKSYSFVQSTEGNDVVLKIGDPNTTIVGPHA